MQHHSLYDTKLNSNLTDLYTIKNVTTSVSNITGGIVSVSAITKRLNKILMIHASVINGDSTMKVGSTFSFKLNGFPKLESNYNFVGYSGASCLVGIINSTTETVTVRVTGGDWYSSYNVGFHIVAIIL